MADQVLRTDGLTKHFGGITAVDGVSFGLDSDECCALIGPNGAGKTTFFNLLTGELEPSEGSVEFHDDDGWHDLTGLAPHETASAGLHRSYQITNLFPTTTVRENVRVAAQAHGDATTRFWRNVGAFPEYVDEAETILERVGLAAKADDIAQNLSHGEKRQLELGVALAGDPDVLLLDEPAAGVSSESVDEVVDLIRNVATDHAVLLVEHNMDVVMDLADRIAVLHQGELIADGPPTEVRDDDAVQEAYLGGYDPDAPTAGDDSGDGSGATGEDGGGVA
ncbi:ABC transporter ATP-binding protein [Haloarchaeobius litoreus]|uniref:Probable branched-chain amino acid transport ATP-binding protein LivG n=1 Tax=Haloarchaeobius litoreus TaxID=755306 RepID=A0ABD6DJU3_9EURY|nr:ABC transporter ATP-binding protein [Haloarchaeobius litoreus]